MRRIKICAVLVLLCVGASYAQSQGAMARPQLTFMTAPVKGAPYCAQDVRRSEHAQRIGEINPAHAQRLQRFEQLADIRWALATAARPILQVHARQLHPRVLGRRQRLADAASVLFRRHAQLQAAMSLRALDEQVHAQHARAAQPLDRARAIHEAERLDL